MKADELMIGDWVNYVDKNNNIKQPCRITMLSDDGSWQARLPLGGKIRGDEQGCPIDEYIEGIELTPEIFQQNGFNKTPWESDAYDCPELKEMDVVIQTRGYLPLWGGADQDNVWSNCKYVHELQHILKFCGIKRIIKINPPTC